MGTSLNLFEGLDPLVDANLVGGDKAVAVLVPSQTNDVRSRSELAGAGFSRVTKKDFISRPLLERKLAR